MLFVFSRPTGVLVFTRLLSMPFAHARLRGFANFHAEQVMSTVEEHMFEHTAYKTRLVGQRSIHHAATWTALFLALAGWLSTPAAGQDVGVSVAVDITPTPPSSDVNPTPDCLIIGTGNGAGDIGFELQVLNPTCTTADGRTGATSCNLDIGLNVTESCSPTEPLRESGSVFPKYMILTVAYAPPGSQDCKYNSTASYGEGNTLGTTVGASSSAKQGTKVTTSVGTESQELGASFGYAGSKSNSQEMTISKTVNSAISAPGPCRDGIDHDADQIWLVLEPELPLSITKSEGCESCSDELSWSLAPDSGTTIWVYAGELKGTLAMRPSTLKAFQAHGITGDDQAAILNADPLAFWAGDSTEAPDASRFVRIPGTFPYEPPVPGASPGSRSYSMTTEASAKSSSESSYEYTVGLSISGSVEFASFLQAKLSVETSWTWTNTNSAAFSESNSTAASVTIGSPSDGYAGPTSIAVYYDTIFKTYAFVSTS
jgi:hypothetical protein